MSPDDEGSRDDAVSDAAKWGIVFDPALVEGRDGDGVWDCHVAAVRAFLTATTQWRAVAQADGRTRALGLDYTAVLAGFTAAGIEVTPRLWDEVRSIEIGALSEMNGTAS